MSYRLQIEKREGVPSNFVTSMVKDRKHLKNNVFLIQYILILMKQLEQEKTIRYCTRNFLKCSTNEGQGPKRNQLHGVFPLDGKQGGLRSRRLCLSLIEKGSRCSSNFPKGQERTMLVKGCW